MSVTADDREPEDRTEKARDRDVVLADAGLPLRLERELRVAVPDVDPPQPAGDDAQDDVEPGVGLAAREISTLLLLLSAGCGDDDEPGRDAGTDAPAGEDAGPDPQGCVEPDRACPDDQPVPGAPCEGDLQCEYEGPNGYDTWIYDCRDGAWLADLDGCQLDGCPIPPLGELCLEPFEGTIEGAAVEIGPPDSTRPFGPFEDGEEVPLIIGAQGGTMVAFRIRAREHRRPSAWG